MPKKKDYILKLPLSKLLPYPAHQNDNSVGKRYADIPEWIDVVIEVVIEVGLVVTCEAL